MRPLLLAVLGLFLAASAWADEMQPLSRGQTVYAPVYSEILHGNLDSSGNPARIPLSAMLSIRNTNRAAAITVTSVSYYSGTGKLLRAFLDKPKSLAPLETIEMFIEHRDMTGGTGASFLIVWESAAPVNPPIVEVVHAYFFGTQSTAFISAGRPIDPAAK
ncbi:MAG TPA: DUF3124 domain-containing protein [Dongiaceae bacterium]|nr:DUF3124 domain-containing protein [Dongiaceae bacterium]